MIGEPSLASIAGLGLKPVDEIDHVVESAASTAADAASGNGDGKVRLPGAGPTDQYGVALLGDEAAGGEVIHERLVDRRTLELEDIEVLGERQLGDGELVLDFSLGPTVLRLGVLYQGAFDLAEHVRPVLRDLVESTGESAAFYIRQGDKRVCLYRHQSAGPIRHHVDEGTEMPLDLGAGSHVLIAYSGGVGPFYDELRAKGYCSAIGELNAETGGVSAAVFGAGGAFIGALGIAGLKSHFDEATL